MKLLLSFFSFILFTGVSCMAQDIHFSQYNSSPMNLNPALTGMFDGDYRFVGNQRNQWRSITLPYTYHTYGGSADARNFMDKENVNAGFSLYNDKAGDSKFSTLQLNLAGAYSKAIDTSHSVTIGIQTGFTQRKINYDNLSFDSQYNGLYYDPGTGNGESFAKTSFIYLNLNSGISWSYIPRERFKIMAGMALYNINKPKQSFFNDRDIKLDRKITLFGSGQFKVNEKLDVLPSFLFMGQGRYREYLVGSSVKYILEDIVGKYRAVYIGSWFRMRDAGFISAGMDYDNINVGISYDINVSNLRPASRSRDGFEVSVIYIIKKFVPFRTKHKACPTFI